MSGSSDRKTAGRRAPVKRNAWRLYWLLVAATLFVFAVMQVWTLPRLQVAGMPPFDLRYLGYSLDEARSYLAALGEEGRTFYLNAQLVLDRLYPALYGPALAIALVALDVRAGGRGWGWVLAVFAIAGMGFDWLENAAVATILLAGPDGVTAAMVADASSWTLLKSASLAIAFAGLAVLALSALPRGLRHMFGNDTKSVPVVKGKDARREKADV
jgi:hypothetical protein